MSAAERPTFTLPAARDLRDRAARMTASADRTGRPRRRYLAQQRRKLASRLLPTLVLYAVVSGATAVVDLLGRGVSTSRVGIAAEAFVSILLAGAALAVPIARRSLDALVALATASVLVATSGWSIVARATGGGASPYILILPLVLGSFVALVTLPVRVTLLVSVAGYAALLVAGAANAPIAAHVLVVASGVAGVLVARARQKQSLATFLRIERLTAALGRMRRVQEQLVVVEKLEALRVLVGGMAHELNNALTVSVASSQAALKLAERDPNGGAIAGAIRRGDGGLARIRRTVDRLRRFAMAAEGTLEPADVGAMLDFALESAIGRARSGVIVEREYDPAVGPIECHVAALAEALFQIARNAVDAMPGGGRIRARVRAEGDRVVLAVADEGGGIPAEELAKIFDPFYSRKGAHGKARADRAGLGLSAVYGLVNALGGSVQVRSRVGEGTEVAIAMPRKRS